MNLITFHNSLMTVMPSGESKTILKEKVGILGDKGYLFGKEFNSHLTEVRRAKNRAMAIMKLNQKGLVLKPFQQGPTSGNQRNGGGQITFVFNHYRYQNGQFSQIKQFSEVYFFTASFTNRIDQLSLVPTSELKRVYPVVKDLSGDKNYPEKISKKTPFFRTKE